ncbi:TPA: ATPase [Candidatus Sumerlaeota bacterium]|jgi:ATP-dependent 26S proteasome regulatory subunit|nr:ATPase [Candidatus Sumerlaeota bacterium]
MPTPPIRFGEIETLIRARYPLLQVISWEESRVLREIGDIGKRLNKRVFVWTINDGILPYSGDALKVRPEGVKGTKDPLMAVRQVLQENDSAIYVFKDLHRYIRESPITRALRDLAEHLRSTYVTVVMLSPVSDIPAELEKDVSIVDYPLPPREHIRAQLRSIADDVRANPNLTVDLGDGAEDALVNAAVGLTLNEAENVFAKTLVSTGRLTRAEVPVIFSEKKQIIRKTGLLEYIEAEENVQEIGGLDHLKKWLIQRKEGFGSEARRYGLPSPKGLLILGVQGCGKSLCAKAAPRMWEVPLLRLDMGQLFGSLVGSSEQNVRRAIQLAESVQPAVLWIDEIDKGFSGLDSSSFSDAGTTSRVFGSILTWLQEKTSSVFVIATANNVQALPPELLRKGRFDEIFFVDLPTQAERENIFRIHISKRRRDPLKFDIKGLAAAADGFSGAEIEQAVISAMFDSFTEKKEVDAAHILHGIKETYPLSKLMAEDIQKRREWAKGRTRPAT